MKKKTSFVLKTKNKVIFVLMFSFLTSFSLGLCGTQSKQWFLLLVTEIKTA